MVDPTSILVQNLIDALRQINTYLALGVATAISAFTLDQRLTRRLDNASASLPEPEPHVSLPGGLVSMAPGHAQIVLMVLCLVAGVMGSYAAEAALGIARLLHHKGPELLTASCTFPSVATAPIGIPLIGVAIPVLLMGTVIWRSWSRIRILTQGSENPGGYLMMFGLFVAAYGGLGAAIMRLPCR